MEQTNKQTIAIEKKQWETPKAEVISSDTVKAGSVAGGHEGSLTPTGFVHVYHS